MTAQSRPRTLRFRAPALVGGTLTYVSGMGDGTRVLALCFLPYPGLIEPALIDEYSERFARFGTTLLIIASGARPLHRLWMQAPRMPQTPVLADPCGMLHRRFDVPLSEAAPRCRTFVIDLDGVVRLRITHDFLDRDLALLGELLETALPQAAPACRVRADQAGGVRVRRSMGSHPLRGTLCIDDKEG